ncbi:MAG: glycosyltransferase family 2 protein [Selenomonadaceae bacterium]|nr:glycosyltransferase family 2 protein [Selenomonadaceae bacterium]
MAGKISVIMPAYNVAEYVAQSIDSVLRQTYAKLELIIIDDGSHDATAAIVKAKGEQDKRIKYFRQDNQGVSAARNAGLSKATGEYVSFLDGDDLWDENILQKLYERITRQDKPSFVYARTEEIFADGHKALVGPTHNTEGYLENFLYKTGELRLTFHISAMLIERQLLVENNLRFEVGVKISEDTGFFIELLCLTAAHCVPEVLSYYMRRQDSATGKKWHPTDWEGQPLIFERIGERVKKYRPAAWTAFCKMRDYAVYRFIRNCVKHGYREEANVYINRWREYLSEFTHNGGKFGDRMKCRLLLTEKSRLYSLFI